MRIETNRTRSVPVNDNVDLIVRDVKFIEGEGEKAKIVEAVELREYLKNAEIEGHGIFVPRSSVKNLLSGLQQVVA